MAATHDMMTPNPIVMTADSAIADAAGRMLKHGIRHLPVVDDNHVPVGMLTDVAVFRYGGLSGDRTLWVPFQEGDVPIRVREVMVPVATRVQPDAPVTATLRAITQSEEDYALVVDDDGALLGIVTEHDGMRVAAEALEDSPLLTRMEISTPVLVARSADSARAVLARMQQGRIRHMAVVDATERAIGVVTVGDLLADNVMFGDAVSIGQVMRPRSPVTIGPDRPLAEAAKRMLAAHIGCLPVVDASGTPRGILTRTDLIEGAVAALEERQAFPAA